MDPRVTELHCIMPIANIASVLTHGIVSHERAAKLPHASVAMDEIQERRDAKQVPRGLRLHQYANLYFHARNPMLFKRRDQAESLCVLRIAIAVLELPGVVLCDCNASSDYARFYAPSQIDALNFDDIYALDWRHPDQRRFHQHRSRKCAEVLVPRIVPPTEVIGALVVNAATADTLRAAGFDRPIRIDAGFFFR